MKDKYYSHEFFVDRKDRVQRSAEVICPIITSFVHPGSIVDVGCATGTFLAYFYNRGFENILGIDGEYVDKELLEIPKETFLSHDLEKKLSLDQRFDLVLALEVAEHLPEEAAEIYIDTLVSLGDVIVFSAAIPHQDGVHHINEQWPEYWQSLFEKHGYVPIDCLRREMWDKKEICFWYAQNMIFYVKKNVLADYPLLNKEYKEDIKQLSLVHPEKYMDLVMQNINLRNRKEESLRVLLKSLPFAIRKTMITRWKRIMAK